MSYRAEDIDEWIELLLHVHCAHTRCEQCEGEEHCRSLGRPVKHLEDGDENGL